MTAPETGLSPGEIHLYCHSPSPSLRLINLAMYYLPSFLQVCDRLIVWSIVMDILTYVFLIPYFLSIGAYLHLYGVK